MALVVMPAERAQALSFVVDDITDPVAGVPADCTAPPVVGACSLRDAVAAADLTAAADTITFNITGAGPHIITLGAPLIPVTGNIIFDATGEAACGQAHCVELNGAGAVPSALTLTTSNNTVRGFVIRNFTGPGIIIVGVGVTGNVIANNFIGLDGTGTLAAGNGTGVAIALGATGNTIGGTVATDRNVISGNGATGGVSIDGAGASSNFVRGNYIGTNAAGTGAVGNAGGGVRIGSVAPGPTTNVIGPGNIISGNGANGVLITGAGTNANRVQGNCIGLRPDCALPLPNVLDGVDIEAGAASNSVGGTLPGAGNNIGFNGDDGVAIGEGAAAGNFNTVTRNAIFLNTGLGIQCDTAAAGCDLTSNESIGDPTLAGCADAGGGNVSCTGTQLLPAVAGITIDVYRANAADPEGDLWLCTTLTGAGGAFGCTFANPGGGSATATATTAGGSTSQFSIMVGIPPGIAPTATPVVVATNTPAPTSTPTTPTATGTPPTRTPTPGSPTATPTLGPMETKTLVAGCNPMSSTYPDNTAVTTLGAAVSPAGALISIWKFDAGVWRGYSPDYPTYSDLSEVDRLDVVFICVDRAGSFQRPKI